MRLGCLPRQACVGYYVPQAVFRVDVDALGKGSAEKCADKGHALTLSQGTGKQRESAFHRLAKGVDKVTKWCVAGPSFSGAIRQNVSLFGPWRGNAPHQHGHDRA